MTFKLIAAQTPNAAATDFVRDEENPDVPASWYRELAAHAIAGFKQRL